ncbi:pseudouridine synthase [Brumimicrobium aurantiacum]|uniref:tRNA pseudouridine synthase C n=1 Tax=Brumimicrobium aurantiacum TaxID=1737063 RepID=A0A3E1EWJ7_9FLAO|nr:pseudouridine synthase [Brumimicrobium aurantiacum]RFC53917.1 pseudouridylate synthase [Brumimicrobium aurantiacum]
MIDQLEIIYEDDYILAINKPAGLLVHRTKIARDVHEFAMQILRDQVGYQVTPIHRLDRKTSGVLLFAKKQEFVHEFQSTLQQDSTQKHYLAVTRGYFPAQISVDHPLTNDAGKKQEARTSFKLIQKVEIDLPFGKFDTSRYSLIEAFPQSGRMHQIRKHLNHLRHPIIGDRPHGCNKQNALFLNKFGLEKMLLHAVSLKLKHPYTKEELIINAKVPEHFKEISNHLGLKLPL